MSEESWRPIFDSSLKDLVPEAYRRLLVPVPPRVPLDSAETPPRHLLRGTFPEVEEKLFSKEFSPVINDLVRLLKVIRNENEWKSIASFFLENVCTNYCLANSKGIAQSEGFKPGREEIFVNVRYIGRRRLYKCFLS